MSAYNIRLRGRVADLAEEVVISAADSTWRTRYDLPKTRRVLMALAQRMALGINRGTLELNFQPISDLRPIYDELAQQPPSPRVVVRWGIPDPTPPQR